MNETDILTDNIFITLASLESRSRFIQNEMEKQAETLALLRQHIAKLNDPNFTYEEEKPS